ncbi:MAG TPA: ATP-binding protein [Polyangia bacterium]|nr:ATP-binding protein [Polyangia bacterium]
MPPPRAPSSFRLIATLTGFIVLLLAGITGMTFRLVTGVFDRVLPSILEDLKWKSERGAVEVAQSADFGILVRDTGAIEIALGDFATSADVLAVVVTDDGGAPLLIHGRTPEPIANLLSGPEHAARAQAGYLVAWAPSLVEGRIVGKVALVVSTARVDNLAQLKRHILETALVGCVLALFLSLFFVSFHLRPIIQLSERTLERLTRFNAALEARVAERTLELKTSLDALGSAQRMLIDASRKTGMAEVATAVLHNVGNVLNSINVSASVVSTVMHTSKTDGVIKLARLLAEQQDPLAFLTGDERGRRLPEYLRLLGPAIEAERARIGDELKSLVKNVEHVKVIISMQQTNAKSGGVVEELALAELCDDTIKLNAASFEKHQVTVQRDYAELPPLSVDRHKLVQIVMNLLSNARHAIKARPDGDAIITVRTRRADDGRVAIEIADSGCGISPEHLTRIFNYGFTTKQDGHGFGLHSSANAAAEMGGTLTAHSDGPGRGARFTLTIPAAGVARQKAA